MDRINSLLDQYKIPIALSIIGVILIIGGIFSSGLNKSKPKSYPKESIVTSEQAQISIDVSGAVLNPGVYKLSSDSRIEDAVRSAGGFSDNADKEYISKSINLAQKISDGSKIYIPKVGDTQTGISFSVGSSNTQKVNINTASQQELENLPGIGAVTADKIIAGRPYQDIKDLVSKKVIGNSLFEKINDQLVVY